MADSNGPARHKCELQDREELIDAYLNDLLDEAPKEAFEAHFFSCDACFEDIHFRQGVRRVVKHGVLKETAEKYLAGVSNRKPAKSSGLSWLFMPVPRFALALLVIIGMGYGGYHLALPAYYSEGSLTKPEIDYLRLQEKSGVSQIQSELEKGAAALRNAPQKRFGIFPYFVPARVDSAIMHFRNACESPQPHARRNYCAYFLGKAYLMKAEPDSACAWLNRVLATNVAEFQDEARELIGRIGCE